MSPSSEPTRVIVQGHTIGLPPTSTHPGNEERSLFVSERYFTHGNVKHERHRLTLFGIIRFVEDKDRERNTVICDCSRSLLMQGHWLCNNGGNIYLIHYMLQENATK